LVLNSKQKVLVTGGSGFIGTNLILELQNQGFEVVNLSNHDPEIEVETLKIDLTTDNLNPLDNHDFDYVVHLAAVSSIKLSQDNEQETMEINVDGTKRLLEYFSGKPIKKFIFMSSVTVYECEKSGQIDENNIMVDESANAYAYSKLLAEQECEKFKEKIELLTFRLANAYGPYQKLPKTPNLIPQVISQALNKGEIEIHNGKFARDFIYISDIVRAIILGLKSNLTGTYNLGTGEPSTVQEIANAIAKELSVEIKDLKLKIDAPLELVPNITRIKEDLGWEPEVSLEEGLKKTIKYYAN